MHRSKATLRLGCIVGGFLILIQSSIIFADSGPTWIQPALDDLDITVMDPWTRLDSDVTVVSAEDDFSNGHIEVEILDATSYDELRLFEEGNLSIDSSAVFWGDERIGTIDNELDGTDGHLRINFSSNAPLVNADFESGDFTGWSVDTNNNQMMGQTWSEGPLYDGSPPSVSLDSDPTYDDQSSGSGTAIIDSNNAYSGNYAAKLNISGQVTAGYGTGHSPSITSSLFSANVGDSIVMHWKAAKTSDYYDVFGFVFEDKDTDGVWDTDESLQRLFHETGAETDGWEDLETQLTIEGNLRFWFINGTYDQTGGRAIGSYLYIDGIELQIAEVGAVDRAIAEYIIEHIEYRNTACSPVTAKEYEIRLEAADGEEGFNSAQISIDVPPMPIMEILGNSITIENGDTSPTTDDGTYFGLVNVDGGSSDSTFTIRNSGVTSLTLNNSPQISIKGDNADDFSITQNPAKSVIVGDSTTFEVHFDPEAGGTRDAMIWIENNDRCKAPYTFAIQGDSAGEPIVSTRIATDLTETGAKLNGKVNPGNSETDVIFEYGLTTDYGMVVTADQSPVNGGSEVSVSANITGLTSNTTYHYRVVADADLGTFPGEDMTFLTVDYPTILFGTDTYPENESVIIKENIKEIIVEYSENVWGDGSERAANNKNNYYLFEALGDGFQNTTCANIAANGVNEEDLRISIDSISYTSHNSEGPFVATLNINGGDPLEPGEYRLFICGTTSITDINGDKLNNGLSDTYLNFKVESNLSGGSSTVDPSGLPTTGFAPSVKTILPKQKHDQEYQDLSSLVLAIPKLDIEGQILGVPFEGDEWNLTWLGDNVGWLEGTAFPTWDGNSVLTAHAYNSEGQASIFANLDQLAWGDEVIINAWGQEYVYKVRSVDDSIAPDDISVLEHENYPWITLISCKGYDEENNTYQYRVVVRAVQVDIR